VSLVTIEKNAVKAPSGLSDDALKVKDALIARGLETPQIETGLSNAEKYQRISKLMSEVVTTLASTTLLFPSFRLSTTKWVLTRW